MIMVWTGTILEVQTNGMVKRQKKPSDGFNTCCNGCCDSGGRRIQAATVSGCICMVGNHVSGILLFRGKRRQHPKDFLLACGSAGMVIWYKNQRLRKSSAVLPEQKRRLIFMKPDRDAPIGVFDSGVGGLTVAREIMRNLPSEKIVYFGDTARVPYGGKSRENIIRYSRQIIHFLMEQQVKAIVIACNTASAFALEAVRDEFDVPILGVIEPGARVAAAETKNKRVGVIGTVGTVDSGIHASYLKKLDPEITVIGKACPLFVPLVEEGWLHDPVTAEVTARYLQEFKDKDVDTLILGCTHYPLIRSVIREFMGEEVRLVNPAYETALELRSLLEKKELLNTGGKTEEFPYRFYVSDLAEKFRAFAGSILPYDVEMTKKIDIEKY